MKRVLFDENMPRKLRRDLPEFFIRTAQEEGWSAFKNGDLLRRATLRFDVLVTIDQRMRYQRAWRWGTPPKPPSEGGGYSSLRR